MCMFHIKGSNHLLNNECVLVEYREKVCFHIHFERTVLEVELKTVSGNIYSRKLQIKHSFDVNFLQNLIKWK